MKKSLLLLVLVTVSVTAFAQSATFGIKGGVNFAQLHSTFDNSSTSITTGSLTTFSAGVFADFKFMNVSLQPGVNFTGRGAKETEEGVHAKAKLFYLQVPVNLVYHVPAVVADFYFGAGPYVAYGLSAKVEISDGTTTESQDVGFGSGDDNYKSVDAGAEIIAGVKLKSGLLFNLNYDIGLSNISNLSGESTKNRVVGVCIGYAFK